MSRKFCLFNIKTKNATTEKQKRPAINNKKTREQATF